MLNSFLLEIKKEYQTNMEGRWREYVICVEKSQIWKADLCIKKNFSIDTLKILPPAGGVHSGMPNAPARFSSF